MEIIQRFPPPGFREKSVVTIGTFDGVHVGHRAIIERVVVRAAQENLPAVVVTFEPHPQLVVPRPDRPHIHLLSLFEEKVALLEALGVTVVVALPFSNELAQTEPGDFVRSVLHEALGAARVVVGYDHTFGKGRSGTVTMLHELGVTFGFDVEVVPKLMVDGAPVSSTRVRQLLTNGDVSGAARLLGRNYTLQGTVVQGRGLGRKLGYPTANLNPPAAKLVPKSGTYAVLVHLDGRRFRGLLNIGVRPTFGEPSAGPVLEVHIYDYEGQLYGETVSVEFLGRIRGEQRFASSRELVRQIEADKEASQAFFANVK
ncbi:MAG: bifunctional riboflavin kinase/FAD synthetase [candidate division KSB1 bacterium]|nr:bifunctional riboflavin kinase/FAD synthetase [candidate division KSB1 bacterium]MDZ7379807.1 bifunctional riboflavin kinase/FAD synthetase [candidate division KSB1 bacterium]MDZ7386450.1 bifunctional riboflavin kinase/FAD synthetase [candidate division KSB1 bacterium]MDZ7393764.1 bifunctional riboflavin kinase/FAD synthetase [candidate division KSB1 bacterium]